MSRNWKETKQKYQPLNLCPTNSHALSPSIPSNLSSTPNKLWKKDSANISISLKNKLTMLKKSVIINLVAANLSTKNLTRTNLLSNSMSTTVWRELVKILNCPRYPKEVNRLKCWRTAATRGQKEKSSFAIISGLLILKNAFQNQKKRRNTRGIKKPSCTILFSRREKFLNMTIYPNSSTILRKFYKESHSCADIHLSTQKDDHIRFYSLNK